jgi:hypothetical protein
VRTDPGRRRSHARAPALVSRPQHLHLEPLAPAHARPGGPRDLPAPLSRRRRCGGAPGSGSRSRRGRSR